MHCGPSGFAPKRHSHRHRRNIHHLPHRKVSDVDTHASLGLFIFIIAYPLHCVDQIIRVWKLRSFHWIHGDPCGCSPNAIIPLHQFGPDLHVMCGCRSVFTLIWVLVTCLWLVESMPVMVSGFCASFLHSICAIFVIWEQPRPPRRFVDNGCNLSNMPNSPCLSLCAVSLPEFLVPPARLHRHLVTHCKILSSDAVWFCMLFFDIYQF